MIRAALLGALCASLTVGGGLAQAAFPGEPGPIVYSKVAYDPDVGVGVGGLFSHGPRIGQRPRQLTTGRFDEEPSISPDGGWIAFTGYDEAAGQQGVYLARSDGSERRRVVANGTRPAFFPDSRTIAFVRVVGEKRQIFSVGIDGSGLRQLTSGPSESFDPAISASGRIAFASTLDRSARDRYDIFTMRGDGGGVRVAIAGPRREREPDWAPNGRRIAYAVGGRSNDLYVARSNGSRPILLTPCRGIRCRRFSHPAFSPNGRHIVALSESNRSSGIEVFRSDGRGSYRTFDDALFGEEGEGDYLGVPTWGPRPR